MNSKTVSLFLALTVATTATTLGACQQSAEDGGTTPGGETVAPTEQESPAAPAAPTEEGGEGGEGGEG